MSDPHPQAPSPSTLENNAGRACTSCSFEWDPDTDLLTRSPECAALFDMPTSAVVTWEDYLARIPDPDRWQLTELLAGLTPAGPSYCISYHFLAPGRQTLILEEHGWAQFDASGQLTRRLGITTDVTARRQTEEALRAADRRKDQFLAMLAHELRNPLTPVRNAAEILRSIDSDDPRLREAVRIIDRQSTHMERLIEDLLDVARISQGGLQLKCENVALADVLTRALELTQHHIEERSQQFDLVLCRPTVRLSCDPVRLCQVFANLIDNAAKYTDEGGEIRLRVRVEGSEVLVRISDNGRGIAPEELPYLFDGLARKRPRPAPPLAGLGLGLSIVKRLVLMHEGKVSATSPGIGRGSCFEVRLPLTLCPESAPEPGLPVAATTDTSPLHILVADDDRDVAESTAMLLRSMGHEVDLATSGEDALRRAREGRYQLVLLDIGLGDTDGLEIARRLRQLPHGRDMRIAAVTGYGDSQTRREARAAGIDRHLLKPLRSEAFLELVRSLRS